MATIKTMNNISKKGLSLFGSFYQVSDSVENPDAILVRSAQVDTDNFDGLLAVARAGAGVNQHAGCKRQRCCRARDDRARHGRP